MTFYDRDSVTEDMGPAEQALVVRACAGDNEAFARIVETHYSRLLRLSMRMLGNRADAEEAVQDTFVRAHRALRTYSEDNRFDAWLSRILVNRCRSAHAKTRRRRAALEASPLDLTDFVDPPEDARLSYDVQRALDALPSEMREAILLKYVDDQSYETMAEVTGDSISALKMRVKRARDRMQALLRQTADDKVHHHD